MNIYKVKKHCKILLIEDNPGDARLVREALKDLHVSHELQVAPDGIQAMEDLRRINKNRTEIRPDIILLDLNLPKKSGLEILSEIKSDEVLKRIPVIILTASQNQDDIREAYNRHANCYIIKPLGLKEFFEIISSLEKLWLNIASLPES